MKAWKYWIARTIPLVMTWPGLAADLAMAYYLGVKVVNHDLRLLANGVLVGFHIAT